MAKPYAVITRQIIDDSDPDPSYLEQKGFEERLQQYRNGDFSFVGVRASAELHTPYGNDWIQSHLTSPGVWGIESDSDESYFDAVFADEKAILLEMLGEMNRLEIV